MINYTVEIDKLRADHMKLNKEINQVSFEATKELVDKRRKLSVKINELTREYEEAQRTAKAAQKGKYMHLVFYWKSGYVFDTRQDNFTKFKDLVFARGLPEKYEIRG